MSGFDPRFPDRLKEGRPLAGIFVGLPSPALVEMAGYAGFDFVIIDNEHGPAGYETTEHLVRAAQSAGTIPIVRVSSNDPAEILHVLDVGASGVQVPQVNTKAEAERAVQAAKYPPLGLRGAASTTRAAGYGFFGGPGHLQASNEGIAVIVHLETVEAVENLDGILQVPGIDVVFIGPTDLSLSMGYGGDANHPQVRGVMEDCARRILAAGKHVGIAGTPGNLGSWIALGVRYVAVNATGLIAGGMRSALATLRGHHGN